LPAPRVSQPLPLLPTTQDGDVVFRDAESQGPSGDIDEVDCFWSKPVAIEDAHCTMAIRHALAQRRPTQQIDGAQASRTTRPKPKQTLKISGASASSPAFSVVLSCYHSESSMTAMDSVTVAVVSLSVATATPTNPPSRMPRVVTMTASIRCRRESIGRTSVRVWGDSTLKLPV
jgi:hypothetical protein